MHFCIFIYEYNIILFGDAIMQKQETIMKPLYEEEGQAQVGGLVGMVVLVGVAILVLIFVGALGGQTYNLVEPDINAINNSDVKASVENGIVSSFKALETTGQYMPIVVVALIIGIVLSVVLGFTAFSGRSGGGAL
jgi:flagellar biosynthesis protein FlhB